jgi:hypothetical protein
MIKALCTAVALAALAAAPAFAKEKEAPACGAVSFRPLANTANDGEMTSGHYRSRFATIDVLAKMKTPPQAIGGTCNGSRFRVVIDSSTKQKLYMLFALQGDDWKLCEAGTKA